MDIYPGDGSVLTYDLSLADDKYKSADIQTSFRVKNGDNIRMDLFVYAKYLSQTIGQPDILQKPRIRIL